jgi:hypothetical protein
VGKPLLALPIAHSWDIEGRLHGVSVRIFPANVGKTGNHTGLTARFRTPLAIGLDLSAQTALDWLSKVAGVQDLRTGNEAFDRRVMIRAKSEAPALALLRSPAVHQPLLEAFGINDLTRVDDYGVHAILHGVRTDPQEIRTLFDLLIRASMAIDSARAAP